MDNTESNNLNSPKDAYNEENYLDNDIKKYFTDFTSEKHEICKPPTEAYLFFPKDDQIFKKDEKNDQKIIRNIFGVKNFTPHEYDVLSNFEEYIKNHNDLNEKEKIIFPEYWERGETLKFLQAGNYETRKTHQNICEYLDWKNLYFPIILNDKSKEILAYSGFCYCHGRDQSYRPNIFFKLELYINNLKKYTYDEWEIAIIFFLDYISNNMMIPGQIEQWNLFVDFEHITISSIPGDVNKLMKLVQSTFISKLNIAYIYGMNKKLEYIWRLILGILDKNIKNKISFIKDENKDEIFKFINKEQIEKKYGGLANNLYENSSDIEKNINQIINKFNSSTSSIDISSSQIIDPIIFFPPIMPSLRFQIKNKRSELLIENNIKSTTSNNKPVEIENVNNLPIKLSPKLNKSTKNKNTSASKKTSKTEDKSKLLTGFNKNLLLNPNLERDLYNKIEKIIEKDEEYDSSVYEDASSHITHLTVDTNNHMHLKGSVRRNSSNLFFTARDLNDMTNGSNINSEKSWKNNHDCNLSSSVKSSKKVIDYEEKVEKIDVIDSLKSKELEVNEKNTANDIFNNIETKIKNNQNNYSEFLIEKNNNSENQEEYKGDQEKEDANSKLTFNLNYESDSNNDLLPENLFNKGSYKNLSIIMEDNEILNHSSVPSKNQSVENIEYNIYKNMTQSNEMLSFGLYRTNTYDKYVIKELDGKNEKKNSNKNIRNVCNKLELINFIENKTNKNLNQNKISTKYFEKLNNTPEFLYNSPEKSDNENFSPIMEENIIKNISIKNNSLGMIIENKIIGDDQIKKENDNNIINEENEIDENENNESTTQTFKKLDSCKNSNLKNISIDNSEHSDFEKDKKDNEIISVKNLKENKEENANVSNIEFKKRTTNDGNTQVNNCRKSFSFTNENNIKEVLLDNYIKLKDENVNKEVDYNLNKLNNQQEIQINNNIDVNFLEDNRLKSAELDNDNTLHTSRNNLISAEEEVNRHVILRKLEKNYKINNSHTNIINNNLTRKLKESLKNNSTVKIFNLKLTQCNINSKANLEKKILNQSEKKLTNCKKNSNISIKINEENSLIEEKVEEIKSNLSSNEDNVNLDITDENISNGEGNYVNEFKIFFEKTKEEIKLRGVTNNNSIDSLIHDLDQNSNDDRVINKMINKNPGNKNEKDSFIMCSNNDLFSFNVNGNTNALNNTSKCDNEQENKFFYTNQDKENKLNSVLNKNLKYDYSIKKNPFNTTQEKSSSLKFTEENDKEEKYKNKKNILNKNIDKKNITENSIIEFKIGERVELINLENNTRQPCCNDLNIHKGCFIF